MPVPLSADLRTVFVYGTLMPGERNAHVAGPEDGFTARPGRVSGFRLVHLSPEGYPGIVPGEGEVQGYALTYTPTAWVEALPLLDLLEGVDETPPLYTREQVKVQLEGGEEVESWAYVYARADRLKAAGAQDVPQGDWHTVAAQGNPPSDQQ